ncbi:MAG: class I SAM-dependent methyltransferase [Planctomycetes bacterium]|nr:class I SAM-dependent methyltransferase [Planctomycetota bacterium]MCW8136001.1 class I SAM-dependent methyltransferase [Planctomycetota bacterium]
MSPNTAIAETSSSHVAWLDRYYGAHRHIYDLTRRLFLLGRQRVLRRIRDERPASVLEVGCGTARNLAWLARRVAGAHLCGVDASREMLRNASKRPGLRLYHKCAEAIAGPAELGSPGGFEVVFFSYSLSMMPEWLGALEAARRCVVPGGVMHVVDFWDFGGWPGPLRGWLNRRLQSHHVHHEPGVLRWLRDAGASVTPVLGRWAYIARLQVGR